MSFSQPGANGTYHSIYDSYAWFSAHMDPDFAYAKALAQVKTTAMLRLSEAAILPMEFGAVQRAVKEWVEEIAKSEAGKKAKLDFRGVEAELARLAGASEAYEARLAAAMAASPASGWNSALLGAERALTAEQGHSGRTWYKHQLTAPGIYTGYSARTLPAIREPLDAGRLDDARSAVSALEATLRGFRELVERAGVAP
jgi:N-acetylated-alpha-linked acidic dipeptidase